MADEQSTTRAITGDDIISELLRNCEAGAFKIRYTTVLPSVYHVYLHPSDYDLIRPVIPAVTAEARSALIDKLEDLTAASKPSGIARTLGFDSGKQMEYKILDPDWSIDFHPDAEDKLAPGEIEIYSELASAARPEFEGAMTRHVTRRRPGRASTSSQMVAADASASATATVGRRAYAVIRYQENGTAQTFDVMKNQVVIGRGGKSFWVDLKVNAPPDVSREHCRIRRDEETGKFFIKDVSQYGTSVDGRRIPSSAPDGQSDRDKNLEAPLPANCRITLADVFDLGFEAVEAS